MDKFPECMQGPNDPCVAFQELYEKYGLQSIALEHKTALLESCEAALQKRDEKISAWNTRASGWISVEDGELPSKKVLATYVNGAGNRRKIVAFHAKRWEVEASPDSDDYCEYNEEKDNYFLMTGWYEQQDNWDDYTAIFVHEGEITDWQPLPDGPVG